MKKLKTFVLALFLMSVAVLCTACLNIDSNWRENQSIKQTYQAQTFFMYGEEYDYCIDSQEEFETFVWYNILYRNNDVKFYKNFELSNTSLSTLAYENINSYPEYTGINVSNTNSYVALVSGNEYKLQNFIYELPEDKLINSYEKTIMGTTYSYENGDLIIKQPGEDDVVISKYTQDPDFRYEFDTELNDRNLPIDEKEGYKVYNSEQLFMVVSYGKKPIIEDQASVVATIYNNARTVLSQINTDDMTDYQKVLNIYNWVLSNNVYDYNILEYMEAVNDYTQLSFGGSPVFYLEGILYDLDNQLAVCDGISKTIALLCNMEGIECIKINGYVSSGNHAWNKVKLGDNWYAIDGTWAEITCSDSESSEYFELMSHSYFLVSDEKLNDIATRTTTWPLDEPAAIDYNYYNNTSLSYDNLQQDLYISSDTELAQLLEIAERTDLNHLEILLDNQYYDSMDGVEGNLQTYVLLVNTADSKQEIEYTTTPTSLIFEYNNNQYAITYNRLLASWSVSQLGQLSAVPVVIINNQFVIDGVIFNFYTIQQQDSIRSYIDNNETLSNNGYTLINNNRISFFYSNGCLMIWFNYQATHR